MPDALDVADRLERTERYLTGTLLPFWVDNSPDFERGGFLTYFDRHGRPTGETTKTFLMQVRMLYTMASAHRAGYGGGRCAQLARHGAGFIADHYWDDQHDGWIWIADADGRPTVTDKIGYGQAFSIYAFSELALATNDDAARRHALRSHDAVCRHMADTRHGGYLELMERDWRPKPPGRSGGDRKSLDVHMHLMEALTNLYALTGHPTHRRRLEEVIDLILSRMLHPEHGVGYIHFTFDFQPLPRIIFETEWGRDAAPEAGEAHPIDMTSPGHNIEFAWLLLHAAEALGRAPEDFAHVLRAACDHCLAWGLDEQCGGVYADVPFHRPALSTEKQFWQQAEALIGLLDAVLLFGEEKYWRAFVNVHDFVFDHLVVMEAGGEWYERVDRDGRPLDDALGHAWKISYHTVRSMIQVVRRLKQLAGGPPESGGAAGPATR
jgi:mannobiose 2-epimerase